MSCYQCGSTNIIEDYREGDTICRGCGLVLSERNIQDTSHYNPCFYEDHEEYIEPLNYNQSIANTFEKCMIHLNFPESILKEASLVFKRIKEHGGNFRGENLKGVIASAIYIACHQQNGGVRHAKEIYETLGVDVTTFNKSLRRIYEIMPDIQEKLSTIKEENTLVRQIRQSVPTLPEKQVYKIYHRVLELDNLRKQKRMLMGSSPYIVNSILIYIVCEEEKIQMSKSEYIERAKISRATLDKHYDTIRMKLRNS